MLTAFINSVPSLRFSSSTAIPGLLIQASQRPWTVRVIQWWAQDLYGLCGDPTYNILGQETDVL
jgi:hypothetical protein